MDSWGLGIRAQMGQSGMIRLTKCLPLMGSKIIKNMKKKKKKNFFTAI